MEERIDKDVCTYMYMYMYVLYIHVPACIHETHMYAGQVEVIYTHVDTHTL